MQEIYGTQKRVKVEGEILFQTFNHCDESDDARAIAKIRDLLSAACFDSFDIKIIERRENIMLVMDENMNATLQKMRSRYPGKPIGEKIDKPATEVIIQDETIKMAGEGSKKVHNSKIEV